MRLFSGLLEKPLTGANEKRRVSFLSSRRIIEPILSRLGRIQHFGAWNSESADLKFDDDSDETLRLEGSLTREFFGRAYISVAVSRIA